VQQHNYISGGVTHQAGYCATLVYATSLQMRQPWALIGRLSLALVVLANLLGTRTDAQIDSWHTGRATYYGDQPWLWTIHHGSCGYGYIWQDYLTGWDVTALSDQHPYFREGSSCG
jgi:hypothetical protein